MELKIFGKSLFSAKKEQGIALWNEINSTKSESKYLADFYKESGRNSIGVLDDYVVIPTQQNGGAAAVPKDRMPSKKKKARARVELKITPKGVYELKMLHDETFKLNTDSKYVEGQLSDFKDKLGLIKSEEWDVRNGVNELKSIVTRLENRKKYPEVKSFFEEFPYTTTARINELTKNQDHLKIGQIAQFIADMPKEAVEIMKNYNVNTDKVCGKQAVFYIIADKKDFKKTDTRRDPILLAQSPFGHFWQILGAWDKEMMFLDNL